MRGYKPMNNLKEALKQILLKAYRGFLYATSMAGVVLTIMMAMGWVQYPEPHSHVFFGAYFGIMLVCFWKGYSD